MPIQSDWDIDHFSIFPLRGKIWLPFLLVSITCVALCLATAIFAGTLFYSWIGVALMAICAISLAAGLLLENAVAKIIMQPDRSAKLPVEDSKQDLNDYQKIQKQLGGRLSSGVEVAMQSEPVIKHITPKRKIKEEENFSEISDVRVRFK